MPSKDQLDQFAAEATRRFEDFSAWLISNWPKKEQPLMHSDLDGARKEIAQLLGPGLGAPESEGATDTDAANDQSAPQYVNVSPMPWP